MPTTFLLGALLSIAGNLCIGLGFRLSPHPPLCWRLGSALMAAGECLNFAAYGLAPASLVAPLDAVAIVVSQTGGGGRPKRRNRMGLALAISGIVGVVLNAPQADEDAVQCVTSWRAAVFLAVAGAVGLWVANPLELGFAVSQTTKHTHAFHYCFLSGLMGALTVVGAKGLSTALRQTMEEGDVPQAIPLPLWLMCALLLATIATSVFLQMRFLGAALDAGFGQGVVVPAYYVCFIPVAVSAGAIIFRETVFHSPAHPALFGASLILAHAGLFAIGREGQEAVVVDDKGKGGGV